MNAYTLLIVAANVATLVAGGTLAVLSHRAFRRTRTEALGTAAVGFVLLVVGAAGGGVLYTVGDSLVGGLAVQSVSTAIAVSVLLYSLYRTSRGPPLQPTAD